MNKVIMTVVIVAIAFVVIGGGILALSGSDKDNDDPLLDSNARTSTNQQSSDQQQVDNNTSTEQEQETDDDFGSVQTVIYDENGFSPEMLTSKAGEKMIIENKSSGTIQVQSDPHPGHSDNRELNVGAIGAGESASVTLTTKGTFGFHDHMNPENTATVVVQ